jgi:hypothetical protein
MTCSTCKQIGHNKTTCGLTVKCKLCNQSGHPASKCTYKTIYKYLKQLPTVLVDIIFDYKTSTEHFDCTSMYFNGQISSRIANITRTLCLKKTMYKRLSVKLDYIKKKLAIADKIQCEIERFNEKRVHLSDLFNFVHDKHWLFCIDDGLLNTIRLKLLHFYIDRNWSNASVFHKIIFGEFLDE